MNARPFRDQSSVSFCFAPWAQSELTNSDALTGLIRSEGPRWHKGFFTGAELDRKRNRVNVVDLHFLTLLARRCRVSGG